LLVTDELVRAIRSESAAALQHWFGVGESAVGAWRKAFGVSRFGTEGSKRLHQRTVAKIVAKTKGKPLAAEVRSKMKKAAAEREDLTGLLERARAKRWAGREWTREQIAALGTMPDDELAEKVGRTEGAVRRRRTNLGIATFRDRRRKS
jgi:hypothetical protein